MTYAFRILNTLFTGETTAVGQSLARMMSATNNTWALAGSLAMAAQLEAAKFSSNKQHFGDIDIVVDDLVSLPRSLAEAFLCVHLHPDAKEGKLLAQFVHPADAIRIDAFRVTGNALSRATLFNFSDFNIKVLSLEDQIANATALCLKLARGGTIAAKHARDFDLLLKVVTMPQIERVWLDYRTACDPNTFETAAALVQSLLLDRSDLLITPELSKDLSSVCSQCISREPYGIASRAEVFAILGYV